MPEFINKGRCNKDLQEFLIAKLRGPTEKQWIEENISFIKKDQYSFVGSFNFENRVYYLKAYFSKGLMNGFLNFAGYSRPFRQWNKINRFKNGLATPEPLLAFSSRYTQAAYYVTDYIDGAHTLMEYLVGEHKVSDLQAEKILFNCGIFLGDMHQQCWLHGDLKWTNLLLNKNDSLLIIDLDGIKRMPLLYRSAAKGKDLARFILNAEEFLENGKLLDFFLKGYCNRQGIERKECVADFYPFLLKLRVKHVDKYGARGQHFF